MLLKEFILVALGSALPIIELRGTIPAALALQLPWQLVLPSAILGSLLPALPILWGLDHLEPLLRKSPALSSLIDKVYAKVRHKGAKLQREEFWGLVLFIGIPLPGTGVWTGLLAAYLFGLSRRSSLLAALLGTTLAGTIITLAGLGLLNLPFALK